MNYWKPGCSWSVMTHSHLRCWKFKILPELVRQRSVVNQLVQSVTQKKIPLSCNVPSHCSVLMIFTCLQKTRFRIQLHSLFLLFFLFLFRSTTTTTASFSQWIWTDTLCLSVVSFQSHFESLAAEDRSPHLVLPGSTSPTFFDNRMNKQSCLIMLFISHFVFDPVSSHFSSNTKFWQR